MGKGLMVADMSGEEALPAELKAHRTARGWTQVELGERIAFSGSYLSDVERGIKVASLPLAEALDKVFGTPGTFVRLRSVALTRDYEEYFGQVVELEQQAHRVDAWELGIPGLLQTEDYARELVRVTQHAAADDEIERIVAARNQRQQMLHTDQAPRLWYVLDEGAIRRVVGGITVMVAQLGRLLDVALLPGNYVQVLPFATGGGIGIGGPVTVFQFQNRDPVAYTESNRGGRLAEDRQEVSARMDELSVIRVSALAPRPSAQLIREVMEDLNGQLAQEHLQLW
jgi:transcriptional regulator with XRE-family HTH domain